MAQAETDIAAIDTGASANNTALEVRTALTSVLARADLAGGTYAHVEQTSAQTITKSSWVPVEFDSEVLDTSSIHEGVTNPSRLTVPATGIYLAGGGGRMEIVTTGRVLHRLAVNGTAVTPQAEEGGSAVSGSFPGDSIVTILSLSANDYVELEVLHTTSVDRDTLPEAYGLWIVRLA